MIQHNNDKGSVTVSAAVYTEIAGTAATNCFGVKGMAARSVQDGLFHLLRKVSVSKGVLVSSTMTTPSPSICTSSSITA